MRKLFYFSMMLVLGYSAVLHSQTQNENTKHAENKDSVEALESNISIYGGGGLLEMSAVGIQTRINRNQLIGVKLSHYMLSGRGFPPSGIGVGAMWTYSFVDARIFNVVNTEITYLHRNL